MADLLMRMPVPYEPKKKNRFIFRFPTPLGIQEWFVSTGARPTYTAEETEIQFLNTSTFVIGRSKNLPINGLLTSSLLESL